MEDITAICIGHARRIAGRVEGGAVAHDGLTQEWQYNLPVGREICRLLEEWGHATLLVDDYGEHGSAPGAYFRAMASLADYLKRQGVARAVELHYNAYNRIARGHEVLYWKGSRRGEAQATYIENRLSTIAELPKRGTKGKTGGRGSEFLQGTHCPANIVEPFFGDNKHDWAYAKENWKRIALEIAQGLRDTIEAERG